jgi:hypothetical protein
MHGNKIHRKKSQESKIITSKAEELDSGNSFLRFSIQHSNYFIVHFCITNPSFIKFQEKKNKK